MTQVGAYYWNQKVILKRKVPWEVAENTVMVNTKVSSLRKKLVNSLPNENWVNFIYLISLLSALLAILIIKEV